MRLPDFLVIGAMKSGTTSLCRDLESNSQIFFPSVKEPHTLCLDDVLTKTGYRNYAALFKGAGPEQICGEGSTGYTKYPQHKGVPGRARKLLGPDLKLIYIVREPVARTLSHHYHMYRSGDAPHDIGKAIEKIPALINVSRYAMQLEPWISEFGRDNVYVVRFEDYIRNRKETVDSLCNFLGVAFDRNAIDPEAVYNAPENQLLAPDYLMGFIRKITRSQWYKRNIHPHVSQWARNIFKLIFYEQAKERPGPPSPALTEHIIEQVWTDAERLSQLMNRNEPIWELNDVRRQHIAKVQDDNTTTH